MEFFNAYTDNEENRRLVPYGESSSSSVTEREKKPMSVEMREADHLMLQPKCLPVREQGTGDDTNAKPLSNNMLSPSFVNSNERLQDNTPNNPESKKTSANILEQDEWLKGLVKMSQKNSNRGGGRGPVGGKWTEEEDVILKYLVEQYGPKSWKKIAQMLGGSRTDVQYLHRWNKVLRPGLQKGPWTEQEDAIVKSMVTSVGVGKVHWNSVAGMLSGRLGKQCRERWFNYLDPSIKRTAWTDEEDNILFESQRHLGNRWCEIVKLLPGRTENALKNRFNSSARKKWHKAHPVGSRSTLSPELLSTLQKVYEESHKVLWARQEQQRAARKSASRNSIWPVSFCPVQAQSHWKEAGDHVHLSKISFLRRSYAVAEANMGQATEWCHHQQNVYQLKPEHACGSSVDVEGSNNAEVVATVGIPDFSAGKTTGGIYSEGTGNLNIQTAKISLNMMYNAQQPPSPKKHRRDGSDESFMFGSTKSSIGSNEYDQNTAGQQQHFDNRRPESTTCTASEKTDCVSEAARSSGVFARDFVPISLLPYFKYLNDGAKRNIMSQLSEDYTKYQREGTIQPDGNHYPTLQQQQQILPPSVQKDGNFAHHQPASMSWGSLPDDGVQDQATEMDNTY